METMAEKIIILKIGGSSITDKAQEETLENETLEWFSKLIASSVDQSMLFPSAITTSSTNPSKPKFIIVHGAGSFGHHSAKRYGLRCGKSILVDESACTDERSNGVNVQYQMEGLCKTRHSVQKLNSAIVGALLKHGVNAVSISPGVSISSIRAHGATNVKGNERLSDGSYDGMKLLCKSIHQALDAGLVPVIHGDACLLYDDKRAGILGGDTLVEGIATLWKESTYHINKTSNAKQSIISQVIFITDVAGVFTSDPKSDKDATLIRHLNVNSHGEVSIGADEGEMDIASSITSLDVSGSIHAHDVTGGLKVSRYIRCIYGYACNLIQTK
jgi:isopentenyl phosphate kinase